MSQMDASQTSRRKEEHIRICLEEDVQSQVAEGNGFGRYRLTHNALPELSFEDIELGSAFLGRKVATPLLISSMTGGTSEAGRINLRLAEAAEIRGWSIGLGSMRAVIEDESVAETFAIRKVAPNVPIIANVGAVQLNYGYGIDECRRLIEVAEADALVFHLNSMQEVFQPEGDTNFRSLYGKIEGIIRSIGVPVGVKEVGWGIDFATAARLESIGVAFIDVAGSGGTSWSQVEKYRFGDPLRAAAADAFTDWGLPTAQSLVEVRKAVRPELMVIASGGIKNGVEAAKALALGANAVGYGRSLLRSATSAAIGTAAIVQQLEQIEFELRAAMFGVGAGSIAQLRETARID